MESEVAEVNKVCEDYKRCSDVSQYLQIDQCWWLLDDYTCDCPVSNQYFHLPCPWQGLPEGSRWIPEKEPTKA